jgi:hypothetical protein
VKAAEQQASPIKKAANGFSGLAGAGARRSVASYAYTGKALRQAGLTLRAETDGADLYADTPARKRRLAHRMFLSSELHAGMGRIAPMGVMLAILLAAFLYASAVVIVEVSDVDARPVFVASVVDGDTVELAGGRRVRLVGYDAYELSEPLGALARQELKGLCPGEAYLDVDDLEPQDRYGRVLGYLWCRRDAGNITWHVSVQKHFIVGDGHRYVKRLLYIPPNEHPYALWMTRHTVRFNTAAEIYVYNDTKSPHKIYGDAVVLTSGVYEVYCGGRLAAGLRLMSHTPNTTTINLPATCATAAPAPVAAAATTDSAAQAVTRTATTTTTQTATSTATLIRTATLRETAAAAKTTTTAAVEKPYMHPITYVAIAAAAVLAICAARRGRSPAQR